MKETKVGVGVLVVVVSAEKEFKVDSILRTLTFPEAGEIELYFWPSLKIQITGKSERKTRNKTIAARFIMVRANSLNEEAPQSHYYP